MKSSLPVALRRFRIRRGMSLADVAARAEMSLQHISDIESGKRDPRLSSVGRIAEALELTLVLAPVSTAHDLHKLLDIVSSPVSEERTATVTAKKRMGSKSTKKVAQQKKLYAELKGKLDVAMRTYGGMFIGDGCVGVQSDFASIYFLGAEPDVYCATVETTKAAYRGECEYAAAAGADGLQLAEIEIAPEDEKLIAEGMHPEEAFLRQFEAPRRELDGLSLSQWIENEKRRLADYGEIYVQEKVIVEDGKGASGEINLSVIINAQALTTEVLNEFIRGFVMNNFEETVWRHRFRFSSAECWPDDSEPTCNS